MSEQIIETKKLLDFSSEDIKTYLKVLKSLVLEDKYIVSRNSNREENKKFTEDFKIDSRKEKEILMNLEFDDFCYAVNNNNPKFSYEVLYVFNKEYELDKLARR